MHGQARITTSFLAFVSATLPTQADKHGSADLPVVCCDPGTVNTKMLEVRPKAVQGRLGWLSLI